MSVEGIDVSYSQGLNLDYAAAKAGGIDFCILKVGGSNGGTRYPDSKYGRHEPAARAAGMQIGHYWFNGGSDPRGDADYFMQVAHYRPGDVIALDLETDPGTTPWNDAQACQFADRIQELTGVIPMTYTYRDLLNRNQYSGMHARGSKLWIAWPGGEDKLQGLGPWGTEWTIWQYTIAPIPGYNVGVDRNISKVPLSEVHGSPEPEKEEEYDMATGAFYRIGSGEGEGTIYHQESPGYPLYSLIGPEWDAYAANKNGYANLDAQVIQSLMRKLGAYVFDDAGRRVLDPSHWTGFKVYQP